MSLTDTVIRTAKAKDKDYKVADERGMYLFVKKAGKYFRLDYRFSGKRKTLSLGVYPLENKKEKQQQAILDLTSSFKAVSLEWFEKNKNKWSDKHASRKMYYLEREIFPNIGDMPIKDITPRILLNVLEQIQNRGAIETAHRIKSICGEVFRYGSMKREHIGQFFLQVTHGNEIKLLCLHHIENNILLIMFDLSNLNDYEFEILCKDIMERSLDTELFVFARGVDGGIDICDEHKKIVVQAKHYVRSSFSQLKSSLKNEVAKVRNINPAQYFVYTSQELTQRNKEIIFEMFSEYMKGISHVIDKTIINSFLEKEENKNIVRKHYKLWLCASNVLSLINNQNIFIDCSELMLDINKNVKLFVDTKSYYESKSKLAKNNIIIITGAPGVGKTTISNMLLLFFASEGYSVRYASDNNISDIKKSISMDITKKEVILLDDFLGQSYLKLRESQPNELKTLISFIQLSPNKKLIMNSRITILNEAIESSLIFKELIERNGESKYIIDLNKMSGIEKAKILYNHLYFNNLPHGYFKNIKSNKNYFKIIMHKNYNPRIIEYVIKKSYLNSVISDTYTEGIIKKLDNPEDVWKDEFRNRLDKVDRIFMNTLFSVSGDSPVVINILEDAFNERINSKNFDTSLNQFESVVKRLADSLLKLYPDGRVSSANPSINDYLRAELSSNINEQKNIIGSATHIEQIVKIAMITRNLSIKEQIKNIVTSGEILSLNTINNSVYFYYLKLVIALCIEDKNIENTTIKCIKNAYRNLSYENIEEYSELILVFLQKDYYLDNVLTSPNDLSIILSPIRLKNMYSIFEQYSIKYPLDILNEESINLIYIELEDCYEIFKDKIIELIHDTIDEEYILLRVIDDYLYCDSEELEKLKNGEIENLCNRVNKDYRHNLSTEIEELLMDVPTLLDITKEDIVVNDVDIESSIREIWDSLENNNDSEYEDDNSKDEELKFITEIFER